MVSLVPRVRRDKPTLSHERMTCMEVWGGNCSTWSSFVVPGLDIWVYSQPFQGQEQGGDVYYLSSCASGRITRMLLGDVSGHGSEASAMSAELRDIMRHNVNYIDQTRVVNNLNEQFEQASSVGRFATAVVSTYFAPTRNLTVCSAGHPPPLIFRSDARRWSLMGSDTKDDLRGANMPFGVVDAQEFTWTTTRLNPGDLFLTYTDSLSEASKADGGWLQADGIAEIAGSVSSDEPGDFLPRLLERIRQLHPDNLATDDTTVVLARANKERVSLRNNLLAPVRFLRGLLR